MLISEKYKYIFIAIPKTGTTAVQSFLLENDSSCKWNRTNINGKKVEFSEHSTAKEVRDLLGKKYEDYTVFTFIRDPYSRGVSGYFFYKNGKTLKSRYFIRNVAAKLNSLITKMIPFSLWSVLKPQKKLTNYFFDEGGNLLIDLVGKTENLDKDLTEICKEIGIPISKEQIPVKNDSKHSAIENYYSNSLHKKLYSKKLQDDIELYQHYKNIIYTEKYRSKNSSKAY